MAPSKRFKALAAVAPQGKIALDEAVQFIKEKSNEKFDPSVELHIRLGIDPKQSSQNVRGSVSLPAGTGKKVTIAAVVGDAQAAAAKEAGADVVGGEDVIATIKAGKIEFDVLVAHPSMMPKLGPVAKILGPRGLMPNPKTETVGPDVAELIKKIKQGKANFKNDEYGIVHLAVGKRSFEADKLKKNIEATLEAVRAAKPKDVKGTYIKSVSLSTTMGPGLALAVKG